jgi:8-oxo-dGTP pyrophosphatase MutT (NUDIX family)
LVRIETLKSRLPEHPGIQSKEEYINTAVLVLLVFMDGEYHFVFQKRGPHIRQNGEVCFPGGVVNPEDGTPENTAVRETTEEMGIPAEKIKIIGQLDTLIAPMGARVDAFVGVADIKGLDEISPNRDEVESVFSVPVSYFEKNEPQVYRAQLKVHPVAVDEKTGEEIVLFPARDLELPEKYHKPWGNMKHSIYVYKSGQNTIWGITARFVMDVVNKLK